MSVPVPLEELADALARRSNTAYVLTVGEDGRAHCVAATLEWGGDELLVPAAGRTSLRNAAARGSVVFLSPPTTGLASAPETGTIPGGSGAAALDAYSLIVDAEAGSADGVLRARPVHAVFHRPAPVSDGQTNGHAHDCVHVYDKAAPAT